MEVLLPELLERADVEVEGGRGGRGSRLGLDREEEFVVKETSLADWEPSRFTREDTMLLVSLLEAGDPGL